MSDWYRYNYHQAFRWKIFASFMSFLVIFWYIDCFIVSNSKTKRKLSLVLAKIISQDPKTSAKWKDLQ